jgi:protein lysine acetyltransferase
MAGEVLLREGEPATWYARVLSGSLEVTHQTPTGSTRLAIVEAGALVGELGLLTGSKRRATIRALTETVVEIGDSERFAESLRDPVFVESLADLVAYRLATLAPPVTISLRNGGQVTLRPGLHDDRAALNAGIAAMSKESLRRRFFSGGMPPQSVIDKLLDVDYVDHFAWVAIDGSDVDHEIVGSARFFRSTVDAESADVSFGVIDKAQRRGIGHVLVEAIGIAASAAGIRRLTADVLRENEAMRSLLRRPSTHASRSDPGVVHFEMDVKEFGTSLTPAVQRQLEVVASSIIWHTAALITDFPPDSRNMSLSDPDHG